ncbi:Uncharacterised protein [Mycobacterium tuberculosis]|uniref:Uncharacterized protein n=1 Tax=Mycobacterium tuberculosis TaxID=1773 RepID=A0A0U0SDP0_MYCTX|nr:hypothetical protein CAB90_03760 [Mycobacterium tuberculosis]CFS99939.1 Uncharacterised protein [Mycobacterium tuberculosis]CMT96483.1 Uncharacterised protein [Mycobacterium tuberculosis]CNV78719.1 Uncharacterised protein [Mycobacterium tuberculosis]COV18495.1 Uncharacterised protein [Mycobacterium tuberculosis]
MKWKQPAGEAKAAWDRRNGAVGRGWRDVVPPERERANRKGGVQVHRDAVNRETLREHGESTGADGEVGEADHGVFRERQAARE